VQRGQRSRGSRRDRADTKRRPAGVGANQLAPCRAQNATCSACLR
jgi:hypothetical protein